MSDIGLKQPGVESAVAFPGLSISGFSVSPNEGIVFFCLKPFEERRVVQSQRRRPLRPRSTSSLRIFKMPSSSRCRRRRSMASAPSAASSSTWKTAPISAIDALLPESPGRHRQKLSDVRAWTACFSTFTVNVPQLDADIDRVKAKQEGVPLENLFETMQIYLGSLYVNDFNRFGRTYQVIAQADAQFRDRPEDITRLKTRNDRGQMVPLGRAGQGRGNPRPQPRAALQRLSRRRNQRRSRAPVTVPARRRR